MKTTYTQEINKIIKDREKSNCTWKDIATELNELYPRANPYIAKLVKQHYVENLKNKHVEGPLSDKEKRIIDELGKHQLQFSPTKLVTELQKRTGKLRNLTIIKNYWYPKKIKEQKLAQAEIDQRKFAAEITEYSTVNIDNIPAPPVLQPMHHPAPPNLLQPMHHPAPPDVLQPMHQPQFTFPDLTLFERDRK
ncbi:16442_t:CDS:1 [Funneliformis caledonium]|uniref:16442_t:CDS:1 n=1 Tax=Funneliformis caledonium TaxID=1117310 RepID=A0A9N9AJC2_9GLOM|nr:16442_t:CDS:1 [Funneliformis caledonium]